MARQWPSRDPEVTSRRAIEHHRVILEPTILMFSRTFQMREGHGADGSVWNFLSVIS